MFEKDLHEKNEVIRLQQQIIGLMISLLQNGLPDIIHLALCCFVKAPIETILEAAGSVINKHGSKQEAPLNRQQFP